MKGKEKGKGDNKAAVVDNSLNAVDRARKYVEEVPRLFKDLNAKELK